MKNVLISIASLIALAMPATAATFTYVGQWTTGGQANFRMTNETSQTVQGWTLQFDWGANITSVWNGAVQSRVGNHYTLANAGWNGTLAPGASVEIGCIFTTTAPGVAPTSLVFSAGSGTAAPVIIKPVITSATSVNINLGQAFSYQIAATQNPTSYGAGGLPAGITVGATTGLLAGKPAMEGNFSIALSATNSGGTGTATLKLAITRLQGDANGDGKVDALDLPPATGSANSTAVKFSYVDQWTTGGQAIFRVTNETSQTLQGWTVQFDWGANITSIWNGAVQSHTGNHYTLKNLGWNSELAPGASVEIGFIFTTSARGVAPTSLVFSGGSGATAPAISKPVITSATSANINLGQAFSYQIAATQNPTSYGAGGLPTGIAFGATTGLITGTPTIAGNFSIALSATNAGGTGNATLVLAITRLQGDANGDGKVDALDIAPPPSDSGQPAQTDLNNDGVINEVDVALALAAASAGTTSNPGGYERMPTVEQRKIVGYFTNWGIYSGFPMTSVRADRINVINYAFLIPLDRTMPAAWDHIVSDYRGWRYADYAKYLQQPAGTTLSAGVGLFDEWADVKAGTAAEALTMSPAIAEGSCFAQLRDLKKAHSKLRSMVSIGGWTLSSPFFSIARSAQKRADFAKSAVYVVARYGFDGIDIDWEYPGGGGLDQYGLGEPATDGANYLLLLQALRDELNRQTAIDGRTYYLSIAAPAGDEKIANIDPAAIADIVDWINVMTYDFHGGWDPTTGMNSPMVNIETNPAMAKWSVTGAMDQYLNGVPALGHAGVAPEQLVLGAPFYGRGWSNVQPGPNGNGLGQAGSSVSGESELSYKSLFTSDMLRFSDGVFKGAGGYTRYWDMVAQVPYLYSSNAKRFITYDDPQSITIKMNYANQKALGGVMFWELSEDLTTVGASLLDAVYDKMKLP